MSKELEYRMYGLVPYNLSPIQQGIQFGHAVQEYNNNIINGVPLTPQGDEVHDSFHKWRLFDKTFIILNGGTTNKNTKGSTSEFIGTLNEHWFTLQNHGIETACFYEPDLGDQLTATVFLVDERVWDKKNYPDFLPTNGLISNIENQPGYSNWVDSIGGERNAWLREFLKQFRLA